ncbi:MAG: alcohol dehydrogenase [Deltaproteobacteria bacterium RIFCSPLOWO2_01_44_7]|nr:MAG: alcohol dehydrogenase [Deltaproteobacteria bacterium RIFCSPHIGHO2_01_FULL_43_49]OGQ16594.1 MAG: alcohol dehydrogenase [Deltaproteobacteria bacterium RIFCSPHIGHO2_02_FULL_44_53]OGQ28410.1 MAG: alcohol dehydrogenase [Deltaproteobacteria bacterium RIFCSPHIGHO2_12_FULL_44_21]OGQ32481.1 MAG: alcohol dehydrogenase [Deltaproteobacteria bacterium RIFCSPLOWO2_01_FULL_45_74]OGQ41607.1 MAG: alcohol dehydrogenase [Deltaproteobacteria bacterium RIFCSPLOWO2_02_FULL_44_34]OGQ43090.1 MAG: alcohol dehy
MRVATYYNNQDIRIEEVSVPKIGEGELLLKVRAAGICGSDVTEWYRTKKMGKVLGHEIAGEVVEVGQGVKQYKKGDRVAASHHVPCYECHFCKLGHHTLCDTLRTTNFDPGGFAEWIRLPAINVRYGVYALPEELTYEEGIFVEPLACTLRGQHKANVRPEQTVLVMGCGNAGLLHILVAKALGIKRIVATDINERRLEIAKQLGADFVFQAAGDLEASLRKINEGRLADVVIPCVGLKPVTEQALQLVERGGTVLFFGLHNPEQILALPMYRVFWEQGLTLMNSYAASPEDHREAVKLMQEGKLSVKKLISHRLPFAEIAKAFELVSKAKESLKVIIDPTR